MLPSCRVLPETTQVFPDHPGRHADVLITAQGSSPVAVATNLTVDYEVQFEVLQLLRLKTSDAFLQAGDAADRIAE